MESFSFSPFIVPVAGILMVLGLGLAGIYSEAHSRRIKADQRMAMLGRGMSVEEIDRLLGRGDEETAVRDPLRSLGNARRAGLVLISSGLGIVIFGLLLAVIVGARLVLIVPAGGLIPLAIGVGFLVDYRLQERELRRFGMEVGAEVSTPEDVRP